MKLLSSIIILFSLVSCQSASMKNQSKLILGSWKITKINSKDVGKNSEARIEFKENGKATGNNSCNNFFSNYKIDLDSITFSKFGSTKRFCQTEQNNLEMEFNKTLSKVAKVTVTQDQLIITNSDNKTIEAKRN